MSVELLLAASWLICWYFFFARRAPARRGADKESGAFALTSYGVFAVLALWSACMWGVPPHTPAGPLLFFGGSLTVFGQYLMCAARRELPLSNYGVLMRISTVRVRTGVYRLLSHPMYIGLTLALFGSTMILGNKYALVALLLLVPLLFLRAVIESAHDI